MSTTTTTTTAAAAASAAALRKEQSWLEKSAHEIALMEKNEAKHGFKAGELAWQYCETRAQHAKVDITGSLLENFYAAIHGAWCTVHLAPPKPAALVRAWNAHTLFVDSNGARLKLSFTVCRDFLSQLITLDTTTSRFVICPEIRDDALLFARSLVGAALKYSEINERVRTLKETLAQRQTEQARAKEAQATVKTQELAQKIDQHKEEQAKLAQEQARLEELRKKEKDAEAKRKLTEAMEASKKAMQEAQRKQREEELAKEQAEREARRAKEDAARAQQTAQKIADQKAGRTKPTETTETANPQKAIGQAMQKATSKDSATMLVDLLERTPEPLEVLREMLLEILRRPALQPLHGTCRRALTSDGTTKTRTTTKKSDAA